MRKVLGILGMLFVGLCVLVAGLAFLSVQREKYQGRRAEQVRMAALTPEQRAREAEEKAQAVAAIEEERRRDAWEVSARGACLLALKDALHDPGSADFGGSAAWYLALRDDGSTLVQPKVRAKNGLGAYQVGLYDCVVRPVEAGVKVESLTRIR